MRNQISSDQELIRAYVQGDENAIRILVNRHKEKLFSYIYFLIKDRALADDVFQDTFIKVVNTLKKGNYNEEGKFIVWVKRIAHNLVIDHFRKNKRMPLVHGNDEYDVFASIGLKEENVEDKMLEVQTHSELRKLVELLPEEQKNVLKMRYFINMSFKDIAEETDVSINTALGRMRYALINLRKLMEEKNISLVS